MTFSFSFLTLFLFLGFGQAFTVSAILIFRHVKKRQRGYLLDILFFLTLYIYMSDLLIPTGMYLVAPFLMFTDFPILFLIPPLLFLYVRGEIATPGAPPRFKIGDILHFLPFLIILVTHIPRILDSSSRKIFLLQNDMIPPPLLWGIDMTLLALIQFLIYLSYCLVMVILFRRSNRNGGGSLRNHWNILLFYFVIFLCLSASFYTLLHYQHYPQRDFSFKRLLLDFPIIIICVYNYVILLSGVQAPPAGKRDKYVKSSLTPGDNERIYARLCRIVEEEALWSDPDMDLRTLAEKTEETYHKLSQVINQTTGLNYHGFINRYRLEEACRLLRDSDMTVLDIAFASGFNSKATFNKVFKEEKNLTPSRFREEFRKKP